MYKTRAFAVLGVETAAASGSTKARRPLGIFFVNRNVMEGLVWDMLIKYGVLSSNLKKKRCSKQKDQKPRNP